MPRPEVLRVLKMSASDWGQLPIEGDTRSTLLKKAQELLTNESKVPSIAERLVAIEESRAKAKAEGGGLTRAGFETAMVQLSKQFGDADADLRQKYEDLSGRVQQLEKAVNALKGKQS